MKKRKRKLVRKCIRTIQSELYFHLSETEQAFLNHLVNHLPKRKKRGKQYGKGNDNNFFSLN